MESGPDATWLRNPGARPYQHGQISDVLLGCQNLEAFAHAQLHLLLLLLWLASLDAWHHCALQAPVNCSDEEASNHDHAHHAFQGVTPAINALWQPGPHLQVSKPTSVLDAKASKDGPLMSDILTAALVQGSADAKQNLTPFFKSSGSKRFVPVTMV